MALDSRQKRGSVVGIGLPFRRWLAHPDGTLAATDRMSLLHWSSAITPEAPSATYDAGPMIGAVLFEPMVAVSILEPNVDVGVT